MFQLDSRLEKSSFKIADLSLSEIRLKDNAYFPWVILVPRVLSSITEIFQLPIEEQKILMDEITTLSSCIHSHFKPTKINIGALGNIVSQLHIHVVGRFKHDPCWPQSVWQENAPEKSYPTDTRDQLVHQLR